MPNAPKQMLTGTAARQDSTTSTTFRNLVPTPRQVFSTTATATLTALFVAECRMSVDTALGSAHHVDGAVAIRRRGLDQQLEVLDPEPSRIQVSARRESHGIGPVALSGGTGFVRNRSFTV